MSSPTGLRRTYSLAGVPHPGPHLVRLHSDYRRLKSAYDRQLAEDDDNEVALAMIMSDLAPIERELADLLQRVDQQPANAALLRGERALAQGADPERSEPRSGKPRA